jgi:uncharacterized protein DUF2442
MPSTCKAFYGTYDGAALVPLRHNHYHGEQRDIDLTAYIATGLIFEPVRNDPTFFRSVSVEGGTIAWPNGADIDPDVLYYDGPPPWASDRARITVERQ